jgi:hypothetical protein
MFVIRIKSKIAACKVSALKVGKTFKDLLKLNLLGSEHWLTPFLHTHIKI